MYKIIWSKRIGFNCLYQLPVAPPPPKLPPPKPPNPPPLPNPPPKPPPVHGELPVLVMITFLQPPPLPPPCPPPEANTITMKIPINIKKTMISPFGPSCDFEIASY